MWLVWTTGEVHKGLRWGNLRERVYFDKLDIDDRMIL